MWSSDCCVQCFQRSCSISFGSKQRRSSSFISYSSWICNFSWGIQTWRDGIKTTAIFPSHCDNVRVDLLSPTFCSSCKWALLSEKLWITSKHRSGEISNGYISRMSHQYVFPSKHPRIPIISKYVKCTFTTYNLSKIKFLSDRDRTRSLQILLNKVS